MTIKNLITLAIVCSLGQVLTASAGVIPLSSGADCQAKSFVCDAIAASGIQVADKHASSKMHSNCSAQINQKLSYSPWDQILVDLNKDESITNIFDAFQGSDLASVTELKDNLDYNAISDSDRQNCNVDEVPIPAAGWLFTSALLGFITFSNRRRA